PFGCSVILPFFLSRPRVVLLYDILVVHLSAASLPQQIAPFQFANSIQMYDRHKDRENEDPTPAQPHLL
ncbi:hypothetical protein, partial [Albidovulum sp.]|uniref:hypothetical protein n=1 Tax=Albidovulum sp. TaxID=1872424 RepID=UPI0039B8E989